MSAERYFIARRLDGAHVGASFASIVLKAETPEAARALLPDLVRGDYAVYAMSARAAREVEAACRTSGRSP